MQNKKESDCIVINTGSPTYSGASVIKIPVTSLVLLSVLFAASAALAEEASQPNPVSSGPAAESSSIADAQSADTPDTSASGLKTEAKPTFEFGVAAAALRVPAYPSSSVKNDRFFAAPWFIYRGDKVQVKEGGVELKAFQSEKLIVDVGIGAALGSDATDTPLRAGLPDLDFIFQLGPRFTVPLIDETVDGIRTRFNWVSGVRLAVSTDFQSLDFQGPLATTELRFRKTGFKNNNLEFNASVGTTWLGDQLMDYFFSVEPQFATPARPAFDADAGFLSLELSAAVIYKPTPKLTTALVFGVNSHAGSGIEESPLFEDTVTTQALLAVSYTIFQSKRLVRVLDE